MAHLTVQTLWRNTVRDMGNTKEDNEPLYVVTRVTPAQNHVRDFNRMPHLAEEDAVIERMAWAVVVGLLFIAIRLAGVL